MTGELTIRPATPGDRAALEAMHSRCSALTRRNRWLGLRTELPRAYLDGALLGSPMHLALVAETADRELVALASLACPELPYREVAILVEDRYQRRGLGTELLDALVRAEPAPLDLVADAYLEQRRPLLLLAKYGALTLTGDHGVVHAVSRRARSRHPTAPTQLVGSG